MKRGPFTPEKKDSKIPGTLMHGLGLRALKRYPFLIPGREDGPRIDIAPWDTLEGGSPASTFSTHRLWVKFWRPRKCVTIALSRKAHLSVASLFRGWRASVSIRHWMVMVLPRDVSQFNFEYSFPCSKSTAFACAAGSSVLVARRSW